MKRAMKGRRMRALILVGGMAAGCSEPQPDGVNGETDDPTDAIEALSQGGWELRHVVDLISGPCLWPSGAELRWVASIEPGEGSAFRIAYVYAGIDAECMLLDLEDGEFEGESTGLFEVRIEGTFEDTFDTVEAAAEVTYNLADFGFVGSHEDCTEAWEISGERSDLTASPCSYAGTMAYVDAEVDGAEPCGAEDGTCVSGEFDLDLFEVTDRDAAEAYIFGDLTAAPFLFYRQMGPLESLPFKLPNIPSEATDQCTVFQVSGRFDNGANNQGSPSGSGDISLHPAARAEVLLGPGSQVDGIEL